MPKDEIRGMVEESKRSIKRQREEFADSIKKELGSLRKGALERLDG